jgi:hypothetical protein
MVRGKCAGWAALLLAWPAICPAQDSGRWHSGPERSEIRWTPEISPVFLSVYQRLWARIDIRVDGQEIADRKGKGRFVTWIEMKDHTGKAHSVYGKVDLEDFSRASSRHEIEYGTTVFLLPGSYQVSMAVEEPSTGKVSLAHRTLRVAPLTGDPMPDSWRDAPPVEFVTVPDPPDRWFLPEVTTRLHLPLDNHRPVHIEIVVNTSPSERSHRATRAREAAMQMLMPAVRAITEAGLASGSISVTFLDVLRHQVAFRQDDVRQLDWPGLADALDRDNPNEIDVAELKVRDQSGQFFAGEVARRLAPAAGVRVAIILSAPLAFAEPQQLHPLDPLDSDAHVLYMRLRTPLRATAGEQDPEPRGRHTVSPPHLPNLPAPSAIAEDQLERTIKTLQPRLFDVGTPAEVRKALAEILRDVSRFCQ